MIQEFPNLCPSIHFQSNAISESQAYPCFHPFDQREKQFTLFHFGASVKWRQNKGESVERAKDRERLETVGG